MRNSRGVEGCDSTCLFATCCLELPVARCLQWLPQFRLPVKPSNPGAKQSIEGTWIEELHRRHQAALIEEIKNQILFKPTECFSISSVFNEDGSDCFPRRRRSAAAKYRTLDDELGDLGELSSSLTSSGDTSAFSAPGVAPSMCKVFKDRKSVESFEAEKTMGSAISTPRRAACSTPTHTQHATSPSPASMPCKRVGWAPAAVTLTPQVRLRSTQTSKTRESHGTRVALEKETCRSFDQTVASPADVAATPRCGTASSSGSSAVHTLNIHLESTPTSRESRISEATPTRHPRYVSGRNDGLFKNVTTTPTLEQVRTRQDAGSTPCNILSTTPLASLNPVVRLEPRLNFCERDVLSTPLRPPQGTKPFLTPFKSVASTSKSMWSTPNVCLKTTPTLQSRCYSEAPRGKLAGTSYDQNAILRATKPCKDSSVSLLSNQNFSPVPNSSSTDPSEQRNVDSPTELPECTAEEPESLKRSPNAGTATRQVVAAEKARGTTNESIQRGDAERSQQDDVTGSPNVSTAADLQGGCSNCRCRIAKEDKACQAVPDNVSVGTMFDGRMYPLA